jgi:hypothetical protein
MTTTAVSFTDTELARSLAEKLIQFLETNQLPDGLLAAEVFADVSLPMWRLQADSPAGVAAIRVEGHPDTGSVPRYRFDPTPTGFVLEFEERWRSGGQNWYCRELIRADISPAGITDLSIYCTGDWDEAQIARHQSEVKLLRP